MGFFQKLKNFGSKIVSGIRKGWDWAKTKIPKIIRGITRVAPVVAPVVDKIKPGLGTAINAGAGTANRVLDALGA